VGSVVAARGALGSGRRCRGGTARVGCSLYDHGTGHDDSRARHDHGTAYDDGPAGYDNAAAHNDGAAHDNAAAHNDGAAYDNAAAHNDGAAYNNGPSHDHARGGGRARILRQCHTPNRQPGVRRLQELARRAYHKLGADDASDNSDWSAILAWATLPD